MVPCSPYLSSVFIFSWVVLDPVSLLLSCLASVVNMAWVGRRNVSWEIASCDWPVGMSVGLFRVLLLIYAEGPRSLWVRCRREEGKRVTSKLVSSISSWSPSVPASSSFLEFLPSCSTWWMVAYKPKEPSLLLSCFLSVSHHRMPTPFLYQVSGWWAGHCDYLMNNGFCCISIKFFLVLWHGIELLINLFDHYLVVAWI